jgi:hypothetical protein
MNAAWPYYTWDSSTGTLIDDDGNAAIFWPVDGELRPMRFESAAEADEYLCEKDIRGTVR